MQEKAYSALAQIVGEERVSRDPQTLTHYGRDWCRVHAPAPSAVVFPGSAEEVQQLVRLANDEGFALVPSGGRTGLSAGATASAGEVVLSLERMNRILDFNPVDRTVRCQAGVVTAALQDYAGEKGLFYPVDFASAGSSQIGGNISTNAGGIKVIRYGMTRDWVAGLKVVTGAGDVLDLNRGLIKNNAGYDLRQLFIGAEGTLGVIVEAEMRLTRPPRELTALLLGVEQFGAIMEVLHVFQNEIELTAFEFFSEKALLRVLEHSQLKRPLESPANYYALLEFENPGGEVSEQALALFERCVENGWVVDGTMSQSLEQLQKLWRLREDISETLAPLTPYKNDIATTVSRIPALLEDVEAVVSAEYPEFEIIWFGHIGDGNVHLNILKPETLSADEFFARCHAVSERIFAAVARCDGTVSAEHGVGLLKKDHLHHSRGAAELELMRALKRAFDPRGVLNPGKIFD